MPEQEAIEPRETGYRDASSIVVPNGPTTSRTARFRVWQAALCFLICLACAVVLQWRAGSFRAEFSGHPDEPAHYVSGLMVTEYVRQGFPGSPLRFAEEYYLHYPKVAIGHWPPFFYLVQAAWCLLFGSSKIAVLLLNACLTAAAATLLVWRASLLLPLLPSLLLGITYIVLPITQQGSQLLMTEALLVLLSFLAVIDFARFWDTGHFRYGFLYGLWTGLAILTKGDGMALLLIPAFAIVITWNWAMLRNPRLLGSVGVALAVGIPTMATVRIHQTSWGSTPFALSYTLEMLRRGPLLFYHILGPALAALLGFSIWRLVADKTGRKPLFAVYLAGALSINFFLLFPTVGAELRHYHQALLPALSLCAYGLSRLSQLWTVARCSVTSAILLVIVAISSLPPAPKVHSGYAEAASLIASRADWAGCVVLIASGAMGEGELISETALLQHRPARYLLRAMKQLASVRWAGANYQLRYRNTDAVTKYLAESPVRLVVTDDLPETDMVPHNRFLKEVLAKETGSWELQQTIDSPGQGRPGHIYVYSNNFKTCSQNPHIEVDMTEILGRVLTTN
jgi:Dolichyl-phosphate-mannose-protein mannosyltransferase